MTVGEHVDDALWWIGRRLRPILHPRRWWIERDAQRARVDQKRRWNAYDAALPEFHEPPPGLDMRVFTEGGTVTFDTADATPGRYVFTVPGFSDPITLTILGEDAPR